MRGLTTELSRDFKPVRRSLSSVRVQAEQRPSTSLTARVLDTSGQLVRDVEVIDLSASGARLAVDGGNKVPDELVCDGGGAPVSEHLCIIALLRDENTRLLRELMMHRVFSFERVQPDRPKR